MKLSPHIRHYFLYAIPALTAIVVLAGCQYSIPLPASGPVTPVQASAQLSASSVALFKELGVTSDTSTELQDRGAPSNNLPRVQALIKQGADVNAQTLSGYRPIMCAIDADRTDLLTLLLDHGADINGRNRFGTTALIMAVENGQPTMVKLLLKRGADVNAQDRAGCTALWSAAALGKTDEVQMLLDYHANVNLRDNAHRTALSWALTMKPTPTATIALLKKYGAKE